MKGARQALANRQLRQQGAWRLLAADHAPLVLGVLQAHLLDKDRRLPGSILVERIEQELKVLAANGIDLPQTAQSYLSQWLADGYLERSYQPESGEESWELSTSALAAIRFVQALAENRSVATESRLSVVMQQLAQLAEQTEADPKIRLEALERERRRIDERIEAARAGRVEVLNREQALERAREVIALADELANDFRRVRDEFRQLNRSLRERIMEDAESRGEVLESLFSGVDLIADSDAGRTFKAFWRLLTDPRQSADYEAALEQVMDREFSRALAPGERRFLISLTRQLLDRGGEVHEVLQVFARGLKHFVQSREYLEQRRLARLVKQAQRSALSIRESVRPFDRIGFDLHLTSTSIRSLDQLHLFDPSLEQIDGGIEHADDAGISLQLIGELVAHSEIDFRRLREHIRALLAEQEQVSVARILERFPAEQGLGSVVGYLAIGMRSGVCSTQRERVHWRGRDGAERSASIPCIYFLRSEFDERVGAA